MIWEISSIIWPSWNLTSLCIWATSGILCFFLHWANVPFAINGNTANKSNFSSNIPSRGRIKGCERDRHVRTSWQKLLLSEPYPNKSATWKQLWDRLTSSQWTLYRTFSMTGCPLCSATVTIVPWLALFLMSVMANGGLRTTGLASASDMSMRISLRAFWFAFLMPEYLNLCSRTC